MENDFNNIDDDLKDSQMNEIINNLQHIEKIASKDKLLDEDLNELITIIQKCMDWGFNEIKKNESEASLQIFELLDYFDQKLKFNKLFKNYNYSLINNINIATCYQMNWNLENNFVYLEKTYNILYDIIMIEIEKNEFNNLLTYLKYLFLISKVCLQIAAVTSQMSNHDESYNWDILGFKFLRKITKLINIIISVDNNTINYKGKQFTINSTNLEAFNIVKKQNANLLKGFSILDAEIKKIKSDLNLKEPKNMTASISKINEYHMFNKINTEWIEYFNIGNIMHLEPVNFEKINQEFYFEDFLNDDFFAVLVLVIGCCLFSIATEKRFIVNQKISSNNKNIFTHLKGIENNNFKQFFDPQFSIS